MSKKIKQTYAYTKKISFDKKRDKKFYLKLFLSIGTVIIGASVAVGLTFGISAAKKETT